MVKITEYEKEYQHFLWRWHFIKENGSPFWDAIDDNGTYKIVEKKWKSRFDEDYEEDKSE